MEPVAILMTALVATLPEPVAPLQEHDIRAELNTIIRNLGEVPARSALLRFNPTSAIGRQLSLEVCGGRPVVVYDSATGSLRCSADLGIFTHAQQAVARTRSVPWGHDRAYWVRQPQSGNPAVEYLFLGADPLRLNDFLDRSLTGGSPFSYFEDAVAFAPFARSFERLFRDQLPAACIVPPETVHWMAKKSFTRSLNRRHSYMIPSTYTEKKHWIRDLKAFVDLADHPVTGTPSLAEAVYCFAFHFSDRPWATFNAALLLDILGYEAQALRTDPFHVLTPEALMIRQTLFAVASAEALEGFLMLLPEPDSARGGGAMDHGEQTLWPALHRFLIGLEAMGAHPATRDALTRAIDMLEPRLPDQALFGRHGVDRANVELVEHARALYRTLMEAPEGSNSMQLFNLISVNRKETLRLLGAYGANRFYALYDLSPAVVNAGLYRATGELYFWGTLLHFALQLKEAQARRAGHSFAPPPLLSASASAPSKNHVGSGFKTYHFWTEAFLGCHLQQTAGVSEETASQVGLAIGSHYRSAMTPLYFLFQLFHGGDLSNVGEDNAAAVDQHRQGMLFGHRLCAEGPEDEK